LSFLAPPAQSAFAGTCPSSYEDIGRSKFGQHEMFDEDEDKEDSEILPERSRLCDHFERRPASKSQMRPLAHIESSASLVFILNSDPKANLLSAPALRSLRTVALAVESQFVSLHRHALQLADTHVEFMFPTKEQEHRQQSTRYQALGPVHSSMYAGIWLSEQWAQFLQSDVHAWVRQAQNAQISSLPSVSSQSAELMDKLVHGSGADNRSDSGYAGPSSRPRVGRVESNGKMGYEFDRRNLFGYSAAESEAPQHSDLLAQNATTASSFAWLFEDSAHSYSLRLGTSVRFAVDRLCDHYIKSCPMSTSTSVFPFCRSAATDGFTTDGSTKISSEDEKASSIPVIDIPSSTSSPSSSSSSSSSSLSSSPSHANLMRHYLHFPSMLVQVQRLDAVYGTRILQDLLMYWMSSAFYESLMYLISGPTPSTPPPPAETPKKVCTHILKM
jgi:hypothetical protein